MIRIRVAELFFQLSVLVSVAAALPAASQPAPQNPSSMTDTTRPHLRVPKSEVPGRRIDLRSLPGAQLFVGPKVRTNKPVPLIVHFHGAPWLIQYHIARHLPRAALITVHLGAGSSAYGRPFERPEGFQSMIDEARSLLPPVHRWSSVTLTAFSAGYGAVRAVLRHEKDLARIDNVLLLDGIHASYSPEKVPPSLGGAVNAADLDAFVTFARLAAAEKRSFVITHSEIFPGTYASTTECADFLLSELALKRRPGLRSGPMGMQQLSLATPGRFHVFGYAGNFAPDHIDHLHAMPFWFRLLAIK